MLRTGRGHAAGRIVAAFSIRSSSGQRCNAAPAHCPAATYQGDRHENPWLARDRIGDARLPACQCAADRPSAYPSKTITLVVPYAAGGFADIRARKIGEKLSKALNVTVIIDNKAGAGGVIGTNYVAKSPPDGYTIGMGNFAPLSVNVSLMSKLPYDPQADIVPIIMIEKSPLILTASPTQGIASVQDVIAKAKAKPGTHHLRLVGHRRRASSLRRDVRPPGRHQHRARALQGRRQRRDRSARRPHRHDVRDGLCGAAVRRGRQDQGDRGDQRQAAAAACPTCRPWPSRGCRDSSLYNWQGIIAPKGTPPEIVARLSKELGDDPARCRTFASHHRPGERARRRHAARSSRRSSRSETAKWAEVIKTANIKAE